MKFTCNMFWDLYPLYSDDMVGKETKDVILEHLKECDCCRKRVESLRAEDRLLEEKIPLTTLEKKSFRQKFKKYNRTMWIDLTVIVTSILIIMASLLYMNRDEIWVMCLTGQLKLVEEAKTKEYRASVYYEKKTGQYWIEAPNLHIVDRVKYNLYWDAEGTSLAMFYEKNEIGQEEKIYHVNISVYEGANSGGYSYRLNGGSVLDIFSEELGRTVEGTVSVTFDGFVKDSMYNLGLQLVEENGDVHRKVMQINVYTKESKLL